MLAMRTGFAFDTLNTRHANSSLVVSVAGDPPAEYDCLIGQCKGSMCATPPAVVFGTQSIECANTPRVEPVGGDFPELCSFAFVSKIDSMCAMPPVN